MCHMLLAATGVCGRIQNMTTMLCYLLYSRKAPAERQQLTPHPMLATQEVVLHHHRHSDVIWQPQ